MALFLAINTSNVALAPLGVISLRAALGSADPAGIWLPTLFATTLSTAVAIVAAKGLQRLYAPVTAYAATAAEPRAQAATPEPDLPGVEATTSPAGCMLALAVIAALIVAMGMNIAGRLGGGDAFGQIVRDLSSGWLLPLLIVLIVLYGVAKRVPIYSTAVAGAVEGFQVAVRIIPFLVAILVAAGMFRASGLLDLLVGAVGPWTGAVGFPAEALPMALLRPLSGSGAYGIMADIMRAVGPDPRVGYLVSTLQGSTETTFYVLAVYFGAVGVTKLRHALAAGLIADVAGVIGAALAVAWLFAGE
jgi:spore maturation protein SpmB